LEDIQRNGWVQFIHPADAEAGSDTWTERVMRKDAFALEYRIRRNDGAYLWHRTHTGPIVEASGNVVAWIGVSVDVDALRRAERTSRQTAEQLARALAAKDEFLTLVSHELRTPLTTIYGNAQILARFGDTLAPETVRGSLRDIEDEANRLQLMVDNMFVLARSDLEQSEAMEPVLLSRAVSRVVDQQRARLPERPIEVEDQVGPWPVRGDGERIEHVVRNLLANAEKYSPAGSPIKVALDRSQDRASVRVLDRGPGLAEDETARAFETFFRGPAVKGYVPGAGIGLSVCKQLIEAQGGDIWIRPRQDGGTEAGFTLPLEETEVIDEY
jgi:signal transduction histidine kinase